MFGIRTATARAANDAAAGEAAPADATQHRDRTAIAAIDALARGAYADLPQDDGDIPRALRALADTLAARERGDLEYAVALSVQASETMASVSFVTADVREMAENTQTIAAAIEELSAGVGQVSVASSRVADNACATRDAGTAGLAAIERATASMDTIAGATDAAGDKVGRVSQAMQDIRQIVGIISDISRQTNLLALNAAIEAARAGEAGRGFAVVAGEVRQLAGQTTQATENIQDKINTLANEMRGLLAVMDQASQAVGSGRSDILAVGERVRAVVDSIDEVTVQMADTAASVNEQSAAIDEVSRSIAIIREKSEHARGNAEHAVAVVRQSEAVIDGRLTGTRQHDAAAVLELAKADHARWKRRLAAMLVGADDLSAAELTDHRHCRLGRWCARTEGTDLARASAFQQLDAPHAAVHRHGRAVFDLFSRGDRIGARTEYDRLEAASREVIALLDTLKGAC